MDPLIYGELAPWYRLLDPTEDHADEAALFGDALAAAVTGSAETLLELGAGAGNNAHYLARRFRCTLTDVAEPMLALSRALNPGCEHVAGDMRSLHLGRAFDAVLVHDAVCYMASEDELRAAAATAFAHTRPGGAALFAPDHLRDSFRESAQMHAGEDGARSLRCVEWWWDADPDDDVCAVDYAFLLRDTGGVRAVHDRHTCGLFARETWLAILAGAGFDPEVHRVPVPDEYCGELFVCRRPA